MKNLWFTHHIVKIMKLELIVLQGELAFKMFHQDGGAVYSVLTNDRNKLVDIFLV